MEPDEPTAEAEQAARDAETVTMLENALRQGVFEVVVEKNIGIGAARIRSVSDLKSREPLRHVAAERLNVLADNIDSALSVAQSAETALNQATGNRSRRV